VRDAILDAVFLRRDRLDALMGALEQGVIAPSTLSALQRLALIEHATPGLRDRATKLFAGRQGPNDATLNRFAAALAGPRDAAKGERAFRDHCSACHRVRDIGFEVGPDLGAEFQRAEEAILLDILAPNDVITAGYGTYDVATADGQSLSGILAGESATSVTLRLPAGLEVVLLRKDIVRLSALNASLMPEALAQTLEPEALADLIAWLRHNGSPGVAGANVVVLFDDEPGFAAQLTQGGGRATIESGEAFSGTSWLAVTPPQRYSPAIQDWNFPIVESPGPHQYRYLRLAWKTRAGKGVMVEIAAGGRWPEAAESNRRYYAGENTTAWRARQVSAVAPAQWQVITVDLWKDNGAFTLTGLAPTAMGGTALFDRIELVGDLRGLESPTPP
jgi:putative heme-binding domain-containing protein